MMTRQEAEVIYDAGKETVVRVLLELSRRVDQLTADFAALKAENAALRERVQSLEERLAKDSHNSHKPPSSDGFAKPKPKSLRPKSERPTGGQPGHLGHTLRMVEKPDHTLPHEVQRCGGCGRSLAEQPPDRVERRQVFDLPEAKLEVTEHQGQVKTCPCGWVTRATFPPEAAAPVQYGPRLKSVGVYMSEYQLLPFDQLAEIMRDLFACEGFSESTLANFKADCSRRLEPVEEVIRDLAAVAPVAGFDETGVRATGSLHWLHTVSSHMLTCYYAHKRRGREAMDAAGILPDYRGCALHDFWKSYFDYGCDHALCNGHLLRELTFLWEEHNQHWAQAMIEHLLAIKEARWVTGKGVRFEDARNVSGADTVEAERRILFRTPDGARAMVIGPAGENLCAMACIKSDRWRSLSRGGMGAVLGAKRIKGIAFAGTKSCEIADTGLVRSVIKKIAKKGRESPVTDVYRNYGTPSQVKVTNTQQCFPTGYWPGGYFEKWERISADYMQEHFDVTPHGCQNCFL